MIVKVPVRNRIEGGMADDNTLIMSIPGEMLVELKNATDEIPYIISSAASVFRMLFKLTAGGFAPDEMELCALYDLCARALNAASDNEGDVISRFDLVLHRTMTKHPEGEVQS